MRIGTEVAILHTRKQLEKLQRKLIKMTDSIIISMDNDNKFIPKESMLCNWCYLWEECTAKVGPNPVRKAK